MSDTGATSTPLSLPEGWSSLDPELAAKLVARLAFEVSGRHVLAGVALVAVARRHANDDVLYRHVSDPERYTVVHLTWGSRRETTPFFPSVEFDGPLSEFLEYERLLSEGQGR